MQRKQHRIFGFTLIELLIVVAIIAILAAIAVPNFLEAQTRAKVSRAKADMRTMATAIESYYVDWNKYPLCADELGNPIDPYPGARGLTQDLEFFETRIFPGITSPIAYITSRLSDPFGERLGDEAPHYHYSTRDYVIRTEDGDTEEWEEYAETMFVPAPSTALWYTLSHGPDVDHDAPGEHDHRTVAQEDDHDHEEGTATVYDPTNGTISNGDVAYWGPSIGFMN